VDAALAEESFREVGACDSDPYDDMMRMVEEELRKAPSGMTDAEISGKFRIPEDRIKSLKTNLLNQIDKSRRSVDAG